MPCLIKTHSCVLLPASQMTSDQRIMHIIIIPLWVVFLLFVSSDFALLISILILLLIGLSWFLISLSWVFNQSSCLTQRSSDCWSSVILSGFTQAPLFKLWLSLCLSFAFNQLNFSASDIRLSYLWILLPSFHFLPSASLTFPDSAGRLYQNSNLSRP